MMLLTLAMAFAVQTAQAETVTKTYLFSGHMESEYYNFVCDGHFYVEGVTGTHYNSSPATWNFNSTGSISFTLADGIVFTFASSSNKISVPSSEYLGGEGNVTFTVSGGTNNYYIWRVEVYDKNNHTLFNEYNWKDNNVEGTKTFSKTINAGTDGLSVKKIVITYSQQDIYLIDASSTTISGVDDSYTYQGSSISPEPTVVCNGRTLTKGEHYTVVYLNNDKSGVASVTIYGKSPYHGLVSKQYALTAASSEMEWAAGSYQATEDMAYTTISVKGDVTLTIAEGVTLSASKGITIADGAKLTINGPGTLTVSNSTEAAAGANAASNIASSGGDVNLGIAGSGGEGHSGIAGNVVVNSGTINVTGGQGGNGGKGISDLLTIYGGTVIISGGQGGDGGAKGTNGTMGDEGDWGQALGGTVTCTVDHGIQERNNGGTWSYLASGSTSDKNYVRVVENTPLSLYDDADNTSAIAAAAGDRMPRTVTLSGRTLYKDGKWNTLCLPFDVVLEGSPLDGDGVDVRMLSESDFSGGTLTLTFTNEGAVTTIEAGKPYIIKWDATGEHLTESNLVFSGVTVKSGITNKETNYVDFCGTFSPEGIFESGTAKHNLYLGAANTLYWPTVTNFKVNSFRAYFQLKNGLTCGTPDADPEQGGSQLSVRAFNLNFGDEDDVTGILSTTDFTDVTDKADVWFTLDGRKLSEKPTKKGLYIVNGRKVFIK